MVRVGSRWSALDHNQLIRVMSAVQLLITLIDGCPHSFDYRTLLRHNQSIEHTHVAFVFTGVVKLLLGSVPAMVTQLFVHTDRQSHWSGLADALPPVQVAGHERFNVSCPAKRHRKRGRGATVSTVTEPSTARLS